MNQFQYIQYACQLGTSQGGANVDLSGANLTVDPSDSSFYVPMCDDNGEFLRKFENDGAGVITVSNLNLDGSPYTPVGTVKLCTPESTGHNEICTKCMLDDANNDGTSLVPYVEA